MHLKSVSYYEKWLLIVHKWPSSCIIWVNNYQLASGIRATKWSNMIIDRIKYHLRVAGIGGLYYLLKAKFRRSVQLMQIKREDCKYPFYLRVPSSDLEVYEQVFLNSEYDFCVNRMPQVIIDAGANIGLVSIYFANRYPGAKIIAIEPERHNFELLKRNAKAYKNIIPLHAALWNNNERIRLADPGRGNWGFVTYRPSSTAKYSNLNETVEGITVNKLLSDYKIEQVDIFKIDIEGAEKEVFTDASTWIHKVDSLIVEFHERFKTGCNRIFYNATNGFRAEWTQGENVYLSRGLISTPE